MTNHPLAVALVLMIGAGLASPARADVASHPSFAPPLDQSAVRSAPLVIPANLSADPTPRVGPGAVNREFGEDLAAMLAAFGSLRGSIAGDVEDIPASAELRALLEALRAKS